MKKTSLFICLMTFILTSTAFAVPKGPCDEPKDVCCEEAVGPYAFSYPKDLGLACERGFNFYGEFLLMKGSEEGLDYAMSNISTAANTWVFPLQVGKVEGFSSGSQEWDWRPGFRVGFGTNNTFDQFNIDIHWTYIRIKANAQANNITGSGDFLPLFLPPITNLNTFMLEDASARWSGDFNTIDISLGKGYHVSRYFISNPKFGVRAAWIDQDMTFRYSFMTGDLNGVKVTAKNDYWAAGLLAGYDGQFIASKNWSIYAKTLFSLLFGKFDISQHAAWRTISTGPSSPQSYDVEDSFYSIQPNAELGAGLAWSRSLNKGEHLLSIKVGYEFIHFWDQNQLRRFFDLDPASNDTVSRGDLSFNGFQFAINLDF
ncbi:MAG: hypothetical protein K1000chlam1_01262 [Candidatus Anoxychlamydiales bacterium]|nr:hypothetical protein [Candidatus Anoxychlamydiales bacterium]